MRKTLTRARARMDRLSDRTKAIGAFFATSVAGRGIGIACQLVQVPIAVRALGSEAFGLWMTLTSLGWVIIFADFGIGQGAQNKLAEAFAAGDDGRARDLCGSALAFLSAAGLLLAAALSLAARAADVNALFHLSDPGVRATSRAAVEAAVLIFCANFPLGMAQRLAYARQEGWSHNVAQALGNVVALGGTIMAARGHWSLPGFLIAAQAPLALSNVGLLVWQMARLRWLAPWGLTWSGPVMREIFRLGAYFGVQQAHLTLMVCLPPIIISTCLGAAAVTPYNLAQRIFNLFSVVQNAVTLPLWPAYSDAKARGDIPWIRRTLRFSLLVTLFGIVMPMAVGAAFARPVLAAWVGHHAPLPSQRLVWLLFAWNAFSFLQQPFGYFLAGLSEVRRLTLFAVVSGTLTAVLMAAWVRRYGAEGVAGGLALGFVPYLVFGSALDALRLLRGLPDSPPRCAGPPPREPALVEGGS